MNSRELRLLAISGSLQEDGANTVLLRASARLAPKHVRIKLAGGLASLPHFNADLDTATPPSEVALWRMRVAGCDGLILSSPECAGVPGVLQNALDWLVGTVHIVGKPVALLSSALRSTHAQKSLSVTLRALGARLMSAEPYFVPVAQKPNIDDIIAEPALRAVLNAMIDDLMCAVDESQSSSADTAVVPALAHASDLSP